MNGSQNFFRSGTNRHEPSASSTTAGSGTVLDSVDLPTFDAAWISSVSRSSALPSSPTTASAGTVAGGRSTDFCSGVSVAQIDS